MSNALRINALIDYWNAEKDGAVLIECGKRIIKRRKDPDKRAGKLTQDQLSEQLDLTRKTVGNWEAGHTHIETVGQLAALSDILECDIEYLTCQCDTLRKENQNAVELYGLSEEALMKLHEYSHSFIFYPFNAQLGIEQLSKLICDQSAFIAFSELCDSYMYSYTPDRKDLELYLSNDESKRPHLPPQFLTWIGRKGIEPSLLLEDTFIKKLRKLFESDNKIAIEKVRD